MNKFNAYNYKTIYVKNVVTSNSLNRTKDTIVRSLVDAALTIRHSYLQEDSNGESRFGNWERTTAFSIPSTSSDQKPFGNHQGERA